MATTQVAKQNVAIRSNDESVPEVDRWREEGLWKGIAQYIAPFASLRLTVALFLMSIFIVLAGTLAQVDKDIWQVIDEYFRIDFNRLFRSEFPFVDIREAFARIDLQIFFPPSFCPGEPITVPEWMHFPFPKGWLIGLAMAINLAAAHLVRFKIQASGTRLLAGLAVIAAGCALTTLVILSGSQQDGTQNEMFVAWPSMRILWQLLQGSAAGGVLLLGCILVFRKRAGIVLLHAGIGLMMFSELLVGVQAVEAQMTIGEGQTANFAQDIRALELAIVESTDPKLDDVVVVPQSLLVEGQTVQHNDLPFDLKLVKFYQNSNLRRKQPGESTPATAGNGLTYAVDEARPGAGTDMSGEVDLPAAYIELSDKQSHQPLGTYLVGLIFSLQDQAEPVTVNGKTYQLSLRFKRSYKPYEIKLIDVRKVDYVGTSTPRDYSSQVHLSELAKNVDREVRIWMNNPLRYGGETFYQSGYHRDPTTGEESTTLQVVSNTGWMIPYVACMIVVVGLLAHFTIVLMRFLNRRSMPNASAQAEQEMEAARTRTRREIARQIAEPASPAGVSGRLWAIVVGIAAIGILYHARPASTPSNEMQIHEFGKLPVAYEGRVKPFDSLARNSLRIISDYQTFKDENGDRQPAIRWLLDVITDSKQAIKHKVFRIRNTELLDTLGLKPRAGSHYSVEEFADRIEELDKQANLAKQVETEQLSPYQKKVLELAEKVRLYIALRRSLDVPLDVGADPRAQIEYLMQIPSTKEELQRFTVPLAIPPRAEGEKWQTLTVAAAQAKLIDLAAAKKATSPAELAAILTADIKRDMEKAGQASIDEAIANRFAAMIQGSVESIADGSTLPREKNAVAVALGNLMQAYKSGQAERFNQELANYQAAIANVPLEELAPGKISFEAWFNHFEPFYQALVLYVAAFLLAVVSWLGWSGPLNRASFCLMVFTLCVHTFALMARMYISGRPPVTNLYSSAVFIGWGCVVMGLLAEIFYRNGVGNIVASVSGFATLLVAHLLTTGVPSFKGDTFTVMQAVLDTQFWLATHVVCITLGYSATFLAGLLGMFYLICGIGLKSFGPSLARDVNRMTYGILCFGIFFSFFGTVLGGLWADDSWGRFWGWDPKENGALIIVLWNALVLHARWGAMIKERGLAVLAVFGNIVTSWSWFGVNELGVGLHSYGFTEGVLLALAAFVVSQLGVMCCGLLHRSGGRPSMA